MKTCDVTGRGAEDRLNTENTGRNGGYSDKGKLGVCVCVVVCVSTYVSQVPSEKTHNLLLGFGRCVDINTKERAADVLHGATRVRNGSVRNGSDIFMKAGEFMVDVNVAVCVCVGWFG